MLYDIRGFVGARNFAFVSAVVIACAALPPSAVGLSWNEETSEELPPLIANNGELISGVKCRGRYCDNVSLKSERIINFVPYSPGVNYVRSRWSKPFSEEGAPRRNRGFCGGGNEFMTGIWCGHDYCDNVAILCTEIEGASRVTANCGVTGWFSEEQGPMELRPGYFAVGLRCNHDYCDNMAIDYCQLIPAELDAHNRERRIYPGVGALQWSPELAQWAQEWAEARANEGNMNHRPNTTDNPFRPGEYIGENIHWSSGPTTGANAVRSWIREKQWYHHDLDDGMAGYGNQPPGCTAPSNDFCGHFTQVVWTATQYVGCGKATGANGNVYFVCNYYPAGNVSGQKPY